MIDKQFLALLACPNCDSRPPLEQKGDELVCTVCGRKYPIMNGIPQLLPESAIEPAPAK